MFVKVFSVVIFLVCISQLVRNEEIKKIAEDCAKEQQISMEELMKMNMTETINTDDKKIQCYFRCLLAKVKLMNPEGELTLDGGILEEAKYKEFYPLCADVSGRDPCDKALNFHNCLVTKVKESEKI